MTGLVCTRKLKNYPNCDSMKGGSFLNPSIALSAIAMAVVDAGTGELPGSNPVNPGCFVWSNPPQRMSRPYFECLLPPLL
jgi:hypothetical protein